MHQYQQAIQHHQQQPAPYQVRSNAISAQQQSVPHYQSQQLPQQSQQQLPQQQQQQQQKLPQQAQQEQQQRMPRPGSFQELLSAPVLPERYNSAPLPHDHPSPAPSLAPVQQQQQQQQQQMTQVPAAQATSVYSGQVVHGPVLTSQGLGSEQLQYSYAPTHVPRAQQMTPARTESGQPQSIHAYRQQQQQQQQQQMTAPQHVAMGGHPSSSAQYLPSQTSSSMYPPMQFPAQHAAGGSQPMQMLYGHPYHGQSSQGMGQQMFPLQQQQQQLPQQLQPEQQQVHLQGQQPLQQGQQPYAHGSVMNAHDPAAQAAFRSSSGFLIPPPVGQMFQPADGPYSSALQSLEQRSHSISSQSNSYQSGHTSHESAAANAAQSQHQAVPSLGKQQRQEQPKQQQNLAAQSQYSYQAVYQQQQQQQQQQQPANSQAGGVLGQSPGGLVWRGIPGPAPAASGAGPMMSAGFSGVQQQQPPQQLPGDLFFLVFTPLHCLHLLVLFKLVLVSSLQLRAAIDQQLCTRVSTLAGHYCTVHRIDL